MAIWAIGSEPVQTGSDQFFVSCEESSRRSVTAKRSDASLCQTLSSHLSDVNSVAFVDNCDAFVSCSGDKTVRLWRRHEVDVWQECDAAMRPLSRHSFGVTSASYCDATGLLAAASLDGKITIWDTKVGDQIAT